RKFFDNEAAMQLQVQAKAAVEKDVEALSDQLQEKFDLLELVLNDVTVDEGKRAAAKKKLDSQIVTLNHNRQKRFEAKNKAHNEWQVLTVRDAMCRGGAVSGYSKAQNRQHALERELAALVNGTFETTSGKLGELINFAQELAESKAFMRANTAGAGVAGWKKDHDDQKLEGQANGGGAQAMLRRKQGLEKPEAKIKGGEEEEHGDHKKEAYKDFEYGEVAKGRKEVKDEIKECEDHE